MTPQDPKTRAKELADAHWSYIKALLIQHGGPDDDVEIIGFHYRTAMEHGHKHGVSDERARLFYPKIGEPLTKEQIASVTGPIPSIKEWEANRQPDRSDSCANYDPKTCVDCDCRHCNGYEMETGETIAPPSATIEEVCGILADRAAGEVFDTSLPSITLPGTENDVWNKYREEVEECRRERPYSFAFIVERWDVLQALQTHRERGGHSPDTYRTVATDLQDMYDGGMPVMEAKRQMLLKNASRNRPGSDCGCTGYYAPEVNAAILASNGHSWTVKGD